VGRQEAGAAEGILHARVDCELRLVVVFVLHIDRGVALPVRREFDVGEVNLGGGVDIAEAGVFVHGCMFALFAAWVVCYLCLNCVSGIAKTAPRGGRGGRC